MDAKTDDKNAGKCPFTGGHGHTNRDWWPTQLDVSVLHRNSNLSDPMDEAFDYAPGCDVPPQGLVLGLDRSQPELEDMDILGPLPVAPVLGRDVADAVGQPGEAQRPHHDRQGTPGPPAQRPVLDLPHGQSPGG